MWLGDRSRQRRLANASLLILMGKKRAECFKKKFFHASMKKSGVRLIARGKAWYNSEFVADHYKAHDEVDLGGSDPVSSFGRQNRTNIRVAPAQIEFFVRGPFFRASRRTPFFD